MRNEPFLNTCSRNLDNLFIYKIPLIWVHLFLNIIIMLESQMGNFGQVTWNISRYLHTHLTKHCNMQTKKIRVAYPRPQAWSAIQGPCSPWQAPFISGLTEFWKQCHPGLDQSRSSSHAHPIAGKHIRVSAINHVERWRGSSFSV